MSEIKTMIALPLMDMVHTSFMTSLLNLKRVGHCQCGVTQSSLVYDARNNLAQQAIDGGFDRILWLDSDMQFEGDLMERLSKHLDDGKEFISGLYVKRHIPTGPVIYEKVVFEKTDTQLKTMAVPYKDYPRDSVFEVQGAGFGCAMMNVDLLKWVQEKFGLPFSPLLGFGEDLTFCYYLNQLGVKMWCDSSIKVMHVGSIGYTEDMYLKQRERERNENGE